MNTQEIWSLAGAILTSIGGAGIIICAVSSFLSTRVAHHIDKKYEQRLSKELERYKLSLEKHRYITKTQFDKEFEIYHELSKAFFSMIVKLSSFTEGTLELKELPEENRKIKLDEIISMIEKAGRAQNVLYENGAFIPNEIFDLYDALYEKANDLFWSYEKRYRAYVFGKLSFDDLVQNEDKITEKEIENNFFALNAKLREYLNTLTIVE